MFRQKGMEFSPSSKWVVSSCAWTATTNVGPCRSGCVGHREFQSERRVAALQRAKASCHEACSERVPEAATTASRVKKDRLEKALGDNDGPELARLQKRHARTEAEAHRRDEVVGKGRARCVCDFDILSPSTNEMVEAAAAPYQKAWSTRAGTECTENNPHTIVLSIDGIGAFH